MLLLCVLQRDCVVAGAYAECVSQIGIIPFRLEHSACACHASFNEPASQRGCGGLRPPAMFPFWCGAAKPHQIRRFRSKGVVRNAATPRASSFQGSLVVVAASVRLTTGCGRSQAHWYDVLWSMAAMPPQAASGECDSHAAAGEGRICGAKPSFTCRVCAVGAVLCLLSGCPLRCRRKGQPEERLFHVAATTRAWDICYRATRVIPFRRDHSPCSCHSYANKTVSRRGAGACGPRPCEDVGGEALHATPLRPATARSRGRLVVIGESVRWIDGCGRSKSNWYNIIGNM